MNVKMTTSIHIAKHNHKKVVCLVYGDKDSSITGLVPYLKLYLLVPIFGSPSLFSLNRWIAVFTHSPSLLPNIWRFAIVCLSTSLHSCSPPFWFNSSASRGWYEALAIAAAAYSRCGFCIDVRSTSIKMGMLLPNDSIAVMSLSRRLSQ